ncbi:MAG: hypothetical protein DMF60_16665 [Acidobacteria bacterium]|nr:MAG: hypothetical protein DMF60_16665 [Acidobacteriota bacterium]
MKRIILAAILAIVLSAVLNGLPYIIEVRALASKAEAQPVVQGGGLAVSIDDVTMDEGNSGTSNMIFTVTLTATGTHPVVVVAYQTADGAPPTGATAPSDYASTSGRVTFGPQSNSETFSVPINGDTDFEETETFVVNLRIIDGPAIIGDGQGIGTIRNDDSQSCTYSISPASQNTSATGGTGTVMVTAAAGCNWTAASNAGFITITSGASGSGNGTVGYSVAANTGAARMGSMTIAGQSFTVNQEAGCGFSIAPASQNFSTSGGTLHHYHIRRER